MTTFIYPYKSGSSSVAALSQATGYKVIRRDQDKSKYVGRPDKRVINWGATALPPNVLSSGEILNHPERVSRVSNKLNFFSDMASDNTGRDFIPPFTTNRREAKSWFSSEKRPASMVFARTKLNGHSGEGIVKLLPEDFDEQAGKLPDSTLYVKYIPKRHEFRVHVFRGNAFLIQQKMRRNDHPLDDTDFKIRSYNNGFIFARNDIRVPDCVVAAAYAAFNISGLDFGAVDVIFNSRHDEAYVLEINTAPGLQGSTVEDYKEVLR
jgi:glutathione synthase/RimK-type ligase-like ATP-grasp enzyme